MAYLYTNPDVDYVRVQIRGLDTNYNNTTRNILFVVYPYGKPNNVLDAVGDTLSNQTSTSSYYTLEHLTPDTRYEVQCVISNINGGAYPDVELFEDFYTDEDPTPTLYPPTFSIGTINPTSVYINFTKPSNATDCGVYVDGSYYDDFSSSPAYVSGLTPNTWYEIKMDSYNSTLNISSGLSTGKSFQTDPLPLNPPTNISLYNPTPEGFSFSATKDPNANRLRIYWGTSSNPTVLRFTQVGNTGTVLDLNPNTTYYVRFKSYDSVTGSESAYSANYSIKTLSNQLTTPVWKTSATDVNFTYIYAEVNAVTYATSYVWELWNATKSSRIAVITNSGIAVAWNGLDPNTSYNLRVMVKATGYLDSAWSSWYAITTHTATPWQWWSNVGQGDPFRITRAEWIAFQDRINTVRYGRGLAYYQFTTTFAAVSTGKPMTAALMNECVNAINDMLAAGYKMATVSPGQTISAAFMEGIKNKLNSLM